MALALYRKYRPATFAQVVGQEHVTEPLRNALASGRINHAYLFSGPRGCGKTSSARIMARSLNCAQGPTAEPCGECNSCVALAPEGPGSIDVVEMDAASHGGVDDARELRDKAFYAPAESRYRVFIIDEAHMVTTQGFNALLKIVEEPPEHLIFIFATTEPEKVLATIRSRTHHYPFRLIPPGPMRELVESNSAAEGVSVEPAVFPLVIRAGGGSARDTQSVLDQLLAGAGPDGVTYQMAVSLLGVTDVALLDDMVLGLAEGDGGRVFGTIEALVEAGHDPRRFAADLLERFRDLLLLRVVPDSATRLITASGDELESMIDQAQKLTPGTLTRFAEIMHTGLTEMRGATAPRLLLELLCSRMLLPAAVGAGSAAADVTEAAVDSAVLHRLERLERRMTVGAPAEETVAAKAEPAAAKPKQAERPQPESPKPESPKPESSKSESPKPEQRAEPETPKAEPAKPAEPVEHRAPEPEQPSEPEPVAEQAAPPEPDPEPEPESTQDTPGTIDAAGLRRVWPDVRAAVRTSSRSVEAMLSNAGVQSVQGNVVVLGHTATPLVRRLSEQRNIDVLAGALTEVLGGEWQVRWVHTGADNLSAAQPAQSTPPPPPARREPPKQQDPPPKPPESAEPAPRRREPERPEPKRRQPEPERDVIPPPDEPPDDEAPPEDYRPPATNGADHRGPADDAIDMLTQHLGARRIDDR